MLDVDTAQLTGVTLKPAQGETLVFSRQTPAQTQPATTSPDWTLTNHNAYEAEAFAKLLRSLSPLRAERWITETQVTPSADWYTLTLAFANDSPRVLHVDPKTRQAVVEGVDAGFVLPQTFMDKLMAEYRDRLVLDLPQDQIDLITYSDGDQSITIHRGVSGRYMLQGSASLEDDQLDQSKAAGLFDALTHLQAQHYQPAPATASATAAPADRTLTIHTKDNTTYTLALHQLDSESPYVTLDAPQLPAYKHRFTLKTETLDKLQADLTKQTQSSR